MQLIVCWGPQSPGFGEAPNHLAPALYQSLAVSRLQCRWAIPRMTMGIPGMFVDQIIACGHFLRTFVCFQCATEKHYFHALPLVFLLIRKTSKKSFLGKIIHIKNIFCNYSYYCSQYCPFSQSSTTGVHLAKKITAFTFLSHSLRAIAIFKNI